MVIFTLAWKDFKSLVTSPIFYVLSGLSACLWSFIYLRQILEFAARSMAGPMMGMSQGSRNIHFDVFASHIWLVNLIFIFVVPALTMRLLSEEKKMRTYDLLLTAPITATDIAVGKFLAGYGAALILAFISMLYPLGTAFFADFAMGPLLASYLGVALVVGLYVAIGVFCSSLTESVFLSVIMGVILNLALWFVSQGSESVGSALWSSVLQHISVGQQFVTFIRGTLQVSAVVFFLSAMGLFVFLTQRVVESSRWR
ncbi:MAG: ABC transporter permease subunit [Bdellovibrionales bacterium]|nr:ABC transporter permease subunit [Bdellovibrionales bacterium]